jgi:predicted lipid-binding transport protein (Tim44 family)
MTPEQIGYWIGVFFGGLVAGALCGLLPLLLGMKKQRRGLALASWISCVLSGLILGLLLAVPVASVFTVVILCLKKPEQQNAVRKFAEQGAERDAGNRAPYPMNEPRAVQKEVIVGIDRTVAATWSRDRIKEEITDLRRQIADFRSEAQQLSAAAGDLVAQIDSGEHPYSRSSDPYKHTDPMYDEASHLNEIADKLEPDVEFLKSLL